LWLWPTCWWELNVNSFVLMDNPSALCFLLYFCLGLLSIITVCGNLLVILTIMYFRQLHTPTNYLILSLAVADLLVGFVVFPLTIEFSFSSCRFEKDLFCQIRSTFDKSLCTSSILQLCCISIDRYYAICHPLTYKMTITVRVAGVMMFVTWSVAAMIGIGIVLGGYSYGTCEETCSVNVVLSNVTGPVFAFFMPAFIMLCIYMKIFFVAQSQRNSIQISISSTVSKTERKATKTLAIVMGVLHFPECMHFSPFNKI
uniref:G-protein coupled receptors family 1 profile domain-containing protein n=1 Tax=Neogobius melanostomus TaxID=47308 RepID=A0A8C6S3A5_9GOBI